MSFKLWLEIVEPYYPKGVKKTTRIYNKDTPFERSNPNAYSWITSRGNRVELVFNVEYFNRAEVSFRVNNKIDDISKINDELRDPEILSSVFTVMREKVDELEINNLWYDPVSSKKILKDLPVEKHKSKLINNLNNLLITIKTHESKDENKIIVEDITLEIIDFLISEKNKYSYDDKKYYSTNEFHNLYTKLINLLNKMNIEYKNIEKDLKRMLEIFGSYREHGYEKHLDKRKNIFAKLFKKYFGDDFEIYNFNLERKNPI